MAAWSMALWAPAGLAQLAAGPALFGNRRWATRTAALMQDLECKPALRPVVRSVERLVRRFGAAELAGLPAPVQRYLRVAPVR